MKLLLTILSLIFLSNNCEDSRDIPLQNSTLEHGLQTVKTMYIASQLESCQGLVPMECMRVKYEKGGDWELFYDEIEGFAFENGFEYTLEVTVREIAEPVADASSLEYKLVKVVDKKPVMTSVDVTKTVSNAQESVEMVAYQELTRGFFQRIEMNPNQVKIYNGNEMKPTIIKPCKKEDWTNIQYLLNSVSIQNLDNLKVPSTNFQMDAAKHAELSVKQKGNLYSSTTFDHDNPPTEIQSLVSKLTLLLQEYR